MEKEILLKRNFHPVEHKGNIPVACGPIIYMSLKQAIIYKNKAFFIIPTKPNHLLKNVVSSFIQLFFSKE